MRKLLMNTVPYLATVCHVYVANIVDFDLFATSFLTLFFLILSNGLIGKTTNSVIVTLFSLMALLYSCILFPPLIAVSFGAVVLISVQAYFVIETYQLSHKHVFSFKESLTMQGAYNNILLGIILIVEVLLS